MQMNQPHLHIERPMNRHRWSFVNRRVATDSIGHSLASFDEQIINDIGGCQYANEGGGREVGGARRRWASLRRRFFFVGFCFVIFFYLSEGKYKKMATVAFLDELATSLHSARMLWADL